MPALENSLAVVFGGGRDIGAAIATSLAQRDAEVAFSYHGSDPGPVSDSIKAAGKEAFAQKVNALDPAAVRSFVVKAQQHFDKPVGVLVNVVGGLVARKKMNEMDDTFWDEVFALNVRSAFAATQAAIPLMTEGAAIVNVSSQAGRDGGGPGA